MENVVIITKNGKNLFRYKTETYERIKDKLTKSGYRLATKEEIEKLSILEPELEKGSEIILGQEPEIVSKKKKPAIEPAIVENDADKVSVD